MNIREEAVVELKVDDTDAAAKWENNKARIREINNELRQLREAGENGSEGYKALQRELREVKAEQSALKHDIDLSTASISQMQSALSYWTNEAKKAEQGSDEWVQATKKIEEIKPVLTEAQAELKSFGAEVEKQPSLWEQMKVSVLSVFTGMGLFELFKSAASAAWEFGKEVFEVTARFEKYEAVLGNALGTQEAAARAMEDLKNFAAVTPFSVDELTESYVKLVNRGLQPTMTEMTQMGDLAASQGKSFDQLTEAILDAVTGEFERLKEFGIRASKSGEEVELSFKGVQQTVANTPEAIQGALLAFGELEGVQGGMAVISETLEGRVSNLGDSFDSLKILLGDGLNPVFNAILDVMDWAIETTKGLITESGPLVSVYENLKDLLGSLWDAFTDVAQSIFGNTDASITLRDVVNTLAIAFQAVTTPLRVALALLQGWYDGVNAAINKVKEFANVLGADFNIDETATFDKMASNFEKNMQGIKNSWSNTMSEVHVNNMKDALDKTLKTEENKLKAAKDRIKAENISEQEKLNQIQNLNKQHDAKVEGLKKESASKQYAERLKEIEKTAKSEEDRVAKTEKLKADFIKKSSNEELAVHKKTQESKTKADEKELEKQKKAKEKLNKDIEKDQAALTKKLEDMQIKAIADDTKRAIAKADLDLKRELEGIKKSQANQATKDKAIQAAEKAHATAVEKIKEDALKKEEKAEADAKKKADAERKKEEAEIKKIKAQRLSDTNKLFDDEFKAAAAKANIELSLTKENSQAMWDAKRTKLEEEAAYKTAKLTREAAEEKARIAESIADRDMQAQRVKAIEDRLSAETKQIETELQQSKKQLQTDANAARKADNEQFYSALNTAMTGDMNAFLAFLQKKNADEATSLQTRLQANMVHIQGIGTAMTTAVTALTKLNEDYTKKKLDNLKLEYDTNVAKLDADFEKGIITHEELEAGKLALSTEFDAENAALKKKEFERNKKLQIASALIAGSMAILSALATPPFFVGLALAVTAGIKTAIDINKIKNQKFEGAKGGVFKNAGVAQGSRHGSNYGDAGIVMHDRQTGEEVGEIEGGEPVMVLSRNTYRNNKGTIDRLLHSSLYRNGAPIHLERGGMFSVTGANAYRNRMFADGGVISYGDDGTTAQSNAIIAENKKVQEEMKQYQKETAENTKAILEVLKGHTGILGAIRDKDPGTNAIMHAISRIQINNSKASA